MAHLDFVGCDVAEEHRAVLDGSEGELQMQKAERRQCQQG